MFQLWYRPASNPQATLLKCWNRSLSMDFVAGKWGRLPARRWKNHSVWNHFWRYQAVKFYSWDSFLSAWERMVGISVIWPVWRHHVATAQTIHNSPSQNSVILQFLNLRNWTILLFLYVKWKIHLYIFFVHILLSHYFIFASFTYPQWINQSPTSAL